MDGFLLINKESGWTSRDVCNKVQNIMNTKKVGHNGTLDPFATGLMLVSLGKATKAITYLEELDKTYEAKLIFGKKTDTGDLTGKFIGEKPIKELSISEIINVLESFIGEIEQIPPMTSSVHYEGKKLYTFAHKGIEVERKPRKVKINSIKLIAYDIKSLTFSCNVSKGTYIRTLGESIAEKLNCVGYLESLNRTTIGKFDLKDAHKLNELKEDYILPIGMVLSNMEKLVLKDKDLLKAKHGECLSFDKQTINDIILIVDEFDNAIAFYKKISNNIYKCVRGI